MKKEPGPILAKRSGHKGPGSFFTGRPTASGRTRERYRWGFTLIELMCVPLVLGVLLASALPSMHRQWLGLRVERAAVDIARAWRASRALAVAQDQQVDWVWDARRRYARLVVDASAAPLEARWSRPWTLSDGVELTVRQEEEPVERVRFFPDGTAGDAPVTCTIGAAGTTLRYDVTLDPATGQARLR